MALKEETFTKGGKTWKTSPSGSGELVDVYYEANEKEFNRVKNTSYNNNGQVIPGSNYAVNVDGKYYILHSQYVFSSERDRFEYLPYPPANETANGNAELYQEIAKDKAIKEQVTGTSPNTSPTNPNTDDTQGGDGSTPTTPPATTPPAAKAFLVYPLDMEKTQQDRIKFTAVEYLPSGNLATGQINFQDRKTVRKPVGIPVFLPIQASITDQNSADWQGANLNEIERTLVNLSLGAMKKQDVKDLTGLFGQFGNKALQEVVKAGDEVRVALAGEAVGIQNLIGRFGTVLNPNLELLFTGPQLRPFEFQFKMSAREKDEANTIKEIIKFFKKNMAPRGKSGEVFLRAPYTFFIEYMYGGGTEPHPGINKIKECALLNCAVDYTPNGTYMTYQDGTMVSYTLSLSFQELEPIYSGDYDAHPIGY